MQPQQPTETQARKVDWVDMGVGYLDDKGRVVIPARLRHSVFGDSERPEVRFRVYPSGHILITPVRKAK